MLVSTRNATSNTHATSSGLEALEQKSFENVNSSDLETKVKGIPITLTLIYFHILG